MSDNQFCCDQMVRHVEDGIIRYDERYDQFSILVRETVDFVISDKIDFCPWCATRLPESYRERWLDELVAMGLEPLEDPIPEAYQSAAWRKKTV